MFTATSKTGLTFMVAGTIPVTGITEDCVAPGVPQVAAKPPPASGIATGVEFVKVLVAGKFVLVVPDPFKTTLLVPGGHMFAGFGLTEIVGS